MRTRTLLLLATALTIGTIAASQAAPGGTADGVGSAESARSTGDVRAKGVIRASMVLRAWDHRRAAAWSRGGAAALAHLYGTGSRTGARDVCDLRRWHSRDLRVVGLRQQVARLLVRTETARRLVLTVTDRTVDGVAIGHGRRTALPVSAWAKHRILLRRVHGEWLVQEVVAQPAR
jgi:hypothetical protein